jgi:hypothetical protein
VAITQKQSTSINKDHNSMLYYKELSDSLDKINDSCIVAIYTFKHSDSLLKEEIHVKEDIITDQENVLQSCHITIDEQERELYKQKRLRTAMGIGAIAAIVLALFL